MTSLKHDLKIACKSACIDPLDVGSTKCCYRQRPAVATCELGCCSFVQTHRTSLPACNTCHQVSVNAATTGTRTTADAHHRIIFSSSYEHGFCDVTSCFKSKTRKTISADLPFALQPAYSVPEDGTWKISLNSASHCSGRYSASIAMQYAASCILSIS